MPWRRLGLVYRPTGHHSLLQTHAALPVAVPLGGDLARVYYSGRDAGNRSSIASLVLRLGEAPRVEEQPSSPLLTPGTGGAFDDSGCSVGCVVPEPAGDRLYYMGWNLGIEVPWRNAIGLALGDARTGRFERFCAGPIMDRDTVDHFSLSYPWVLKLGTADWRMWYGTHLAWGTNRSDMHHAIRAARSPDGIQWTRDAKVVLAPEGEEIAVVRPCVLAAGSAAEMWFTHRADDGPYRLAHADSEDLIHWRRDTIAVLEPDPDGWEAGAIAYASAFLAADRRWLLYNGAGYGKAGFGLAVWEG